MPLSTSLPPGTRPLALLSLMLDGDMGMVYLLGLYHFTTAASTSEIFLNVHTTSTVVNYESSSLLDYKPNYKFYTTARTTYMSQPRIPDQPHQLPKPPVLYFTVSPYASIFPYPASLNSRPNATSRGITFYPNRDYTYP